MAEQFPKKVAKAGLTEDLAEDIKEKWREGNRAIVSYWHNVETAAKKAVEKPNALEEVIEGAVGEPVFFAYNFRSDLERIVKKFPFAVHINDKNAVERWNHGEIQLLLGHPASAGHGLNLQFGGHIACWFGLNWSLELYNQFNARLPREGQLNEVIIHHIVMKNSIEETVLKALKDKENTEQDLLQALKRDIRRRIA